jgi:hypothetical protein
MSHFSYSPAGMKASIFILLYLNIESKGSRNSIFKPGNNWFYAFHLKTILSPVIQYRFGNVAFKLMRCCERKGSCFLYAGYWLICTG